MQEVCPWCGPQSLRLRVRVERKQARDARTLSTGAVALTAHISPETIAEKMIWSAPPRILFSREEKPYYKVDNLPRLLGRHNRLVG